MALLYLPMLAIFAVALGYFILLVIAEMLQAAQDRRANGPQAQSEHPVVHNLRQMTQEISAIFSLGDD